MHRSLQVIKPLAIDDDVLYTSNVPETDYAEYAAGTTYALGARVIRGALHKVYESAADANLGNAPESSPTLWFEVGPTNLWRMFDTSVSSQTAQAQSISFTLRPGVACDAIAVMNLTDCLSVRVRVVDATLGTLYDNTNDIAPLPADATWYSWFFGTRPFTTQFSELALIHIPSAEILVDFTGTDALAVGVVTVGTLFEIGNGIRAGSKVGIQDYSRKETNDFGETVLVQRAYARRAAYDIVLDSAAVDAVQSLLAELRAVPCLWIGSTSYESTVIFGFYKQFDILITYPNISDCSIEIEGLI